MFKIQRKLSRESYSAVKAIKRQKRSILKEAEEFGVKSVIVCVYFNYREQKLNTELTFFFFLLLLIQTQQLVQVETRPWVVQQLRVQFPVFAVFTPKAIRAAAAAE